MTSAIKKARHGLTRQLNVTLKKVLDNDTCGLYYKSFNSCNWCSDAVSLPPSSDICEQGWSHKCSYPYDYTGTGSYKRKTFDAMFLAHMIWHTWYAFDDIEYWD